MAGGGPLGAIYEIGALAALAESLDGINLNDLEIYVGVSAGAFISAGLANGITPAQMCAAFIESDSADARAARKQPRNDTFDPAVLLKPAFAEYWKRIASLPPLLLGAAFSYLTTPQSMMAAFERLGQAIPTGIFTGAGIDKYLTKALSHSGRTNQFKHLRKRLVVVATDLDSGESVSFGTPGFDNVTISRAVQASTALPGLFPPVEINGRYFVDGALKKTLHASVALKHGVDLLICLNPLVPFNAQSFLPRGQTDPLGSALVAGGLPSVLSQTFRAIIHSRMEVGMEKYEVQYPGADIVLFEPDHHDPEVFFTNIFSYSQRRHLCEYAYQRTRRELWERRHTLEPQLAKHGITLKLDLLTDTSRTLVEGARAPHEALSLSGKVTARLQDALDDLERFMQTKT